MYSSQQIGTPGRAPSAVWLCLAVALLSLTSAIGSGKAEELDLSPLESICADGNDVAVVEEAASASKGVTTWRVLSVLSGSPPTNLVVRESGLATGPADGRVILAVTQLREDPLFREQRVVDPEGYRVVDIVDFGPAILPWSVELERLIRSASRSAAKERARLGDLESLITGEAEGPRRLALLELELRPSWVPEASHATSVALQSVLDREEGRGWEEKSLALAAGRRLPDSLSQEWLLLSSRRILDGAPVSLALASFQPALVQMALVILAEEGTPADGGLAAELLSSNSPGVVREAVSAVRSLDCAAGLEVASELLQQSEPLHEESRRVLKDYSRGGCEGR